MSLFSFMSRPTEKIPGKITWSDNLRDGPSELVVKISRGSIRISPQDEEEMTPAYVRALGKALIETADAYEAHQRGR